MSRQFSPQTNGKDLETAWRTGLPDGSEAAETGGAVSAEEAGYLTPDQGPFECQNCLYFVSDGQPCQKVAEPVQSQGVCTLYQTKGGKAQDKPAGEGGMEGGADAVPQQSGSF